MKKASVWFSPHWMDRVKKNPGFRCRHSPWWYSLLSIWQFKWVLTLFLNLPVGWIITDCQHQEAVLGSTRTSWGAFTLRPPFYSFRFLEQQSLKYVSLPLGPGWPSGRLPASRSSWKLLPSHQDRVWDLSSAPGLLSMQSWRPPGRSLLPTVSCRPRVSNLRSPNKAWNLMASLVNPVKCSKNECQTCSNCPYKWRGENS